MDYLNALDDNITLLVDEKRLPVHGHERLRIAIVTENFLPKIDGVTRTLAILLQHLRQCGHSAIVLGPNDGDMTSYAGHEIVGTMGIPLLGVYKGLKLNFPRPGFISKLSEFCPDVIHFVDPIWLCAQVIPLVQHFFPTTPLVSSYHTNLAMYATLFGFDPLTSVIWALQRRLHARCALSFCPSPSTREMLESKAFTNVRLWPRGIDTGLFRPSNRDTELRTRWSAVSSLSAASSAASSLSPAPSTSPKTIILFVGRISWEKNLRLLIDAFSGLQDTCQLVIVGDGPAKPALEAINAERGLGVIFPGFLRGQELARAFASADVFAFPSWTETFGQVILEAQASGLPVVGLRAEGVRDLVQHGRTGLLLDMNDVLCMAGHKPVASATDIDMHALLHPQSNTYAHAVTLYRSLLCQISRQHALREQMSQDAHVFASGHSWFDAMEMLVSGYREVVQKATALSRMPTLELDIISHTPPSPSLLAVDQQSAATSRTLRRQITGFEIFRRGNEQQHQLASSNVALRAPTKPRLPHDTLLDLLTSLLKISAAVMSLSLVYYSISRLLERNLELAAVR